MTLQLGILLALFSALITNLSFLLKHRGAREAPPVTLRHPLRTAAALFHSKWFAIGWAVAVVAWCFHVGALALAPLSVVQAVLSGGLVFLTVLAERWFGCSLGRRQWMGVGFTALGLVLLTITLPSHAGDSSSYSVAGMIAFEASLLAVGAFLVFSPGLGNHQHHGVLLGVAAGILFGVSDVAIKALTGAGGFMEVLVSPWLALAATGSVIAFYTSARGLQEGAAVPVIAATSTAANVSCILGGIIVFGDPVAGDAVGIVLQGLAFAMVVLAALLAPPPVRAAEANAA